MTGTAPETPPGSPAPQEPVPAITPVEALAAELETEANAPSDSPRSAYRALLLSDFAELIRQRLGPAWDALAAGNASLAARIDELAADVETLEADNAGLREQLERTGKRGERWALRAAQACEERDAAAGERDRLARLTAAARRPVTAGELAAVMWNAICEAGHPDGHLPAFTDLARYGDPVELPDGPGVITLMLAAATEALKPTVPDLDQAAELIRAQDAEKALRRQLRDLREIAADPGLTRAGQDDAIREYLASTEPEARS